MNTVAFTLDPRLDQDTQHVIDGPFSRIVLMNDARFPWLIVVPRVPNVREWLDLDSAQQSQLQFEINACAQALQAIFPDGEKLNIAALGNVVNQLHVHVILRNQHDVAWPNPVWGFGQRTFYKADAMKDLASHLADTLQSKLLP
jgi:diadenosine tetraphosphate (Ap4A) HIT family hydrolase